MLVACRRSVASAATASVVAHRLGRPAVAVAAAVPRVLPTLPNGHGSHVAAAAAAAQGTPGQHQGQYQRHPGQDQRRFLHMTPREADHLLLHQAGRLAQSRLARGLRLNYPESLALITTVMMERIRDGEKSVADLMTLGQSLLGTKQVMPGVANMIKDVQVEATFPDGTKLLTVHRPISKEHGDLQEALMGSFLPVPALDVFEVRNKKGEDDKDQQTDRYYPGQVMTDPDAPDIVLNAGRSTIELSVTNTGDRPVQVRAYVRTYAHTCTVGYLLFYIIITTMDG